MTATDEGLLRRALAGPDEPGTLARAALVAARHCNPALDIEHYVALVRDDGQRLRARIPADAARTALIVHLNRFVFEELGFRGNQDAYYDPRNSLLDQVIDRRLGIPITLSIVYLELGWQLGLPLEGIAFPGHFLVKCSMDRGMVILDPFNAGASLSEQGLRARLEQQSIAAAGDAALGEWLQPADRRAIVARLLRNLKRIYLDNAQLAEAIRILDLLLVVEPTAARDLRERGHLYRRLECWGAAVADLEAALASGALPEDEVDDTRHALFELRMRPRLLH